MLCLSQKGSQISHPQGPSCINNTCLFSTGHGYISTPLVLSAAYCFPVVYIVQGAEIVALNGECMHGLTYKLPLSID